MDNQKNIQQTNITTRKARTNATKPEYKIDNQKPTLDSFPQLPKQTHKEDNQQQQKTTDNQKTQNDIGNYGYTRNSTGRYARHHGHTRNRP